MIGEASDAKHIRLLVWLETSVVEVNTLRRLWRIIWHRDLDEYEVRAFDNGRFRPAWDGQCYCDSFDEALAEIEASEAEHDDNHDQ